MHKIILIEDDDIIRENIVDILEISSFEVKAFSNGNLALSELGKFCPDLILCDIMMPDIAGYDILKAVRSHDKCNATPFVFITAKAEKADMRHGMDLGADDYLIKPFTMQELLSAINSRIVRKENTDLEINQKLHSKFHSFSKLLSHEYNTPLNGIIGLSEILLETLETIKKEELPEFLMAIRQSGLRLKKINNKLLTYINVQRPDQHLYMEPLSVNSIFIAIENTINECAAEYRRNKDFKVTQYFAEDADLIPWSQAYYTAIEELIENAFKFSIKGSPIHITLVIEDQELKFSISNQGRLPDMQLDKEPEISLERYLNGKTGFGIGLFMVKNICSITGSHCAIYQQDNLVKASFCVPIKALYENSDSSSVRT